LSQETLHQTLGQFSYRKARHQDFTSNFEAYQAKWLREGEKKQLCVHLLGVLIQPVQTFVDYIPQIGNNGEAGRPLMRSITAAPSEFFRTTRMS